MATRPPPPADLDLRDLDLDKEPKPRPKPKHDGLHMALAGALSGAASRTLVAPFDRVKLLAQVAAVPGSLSTSTSGSSSSSFSSATSSSSSSAVANATARRSTAATLRAIYEADGVRGLFRGNVAALLRTIPYSAVQLSTHDLLKRRIAASSSESAICCKLYTADGATTVCHTKICHLTIHNLTQPHKDTTTSRHFHIKTIHKKRTNTTLHHLCLKPL